jgi:gliding motility-associated-like protein
MRISQLFLLFILFPFTGFSQLTIINNSSASALAQAIVGSGITVSNATMNTGISSTGTFTYTGANLGLPDGVVLTSGYASDVANPGTVFSNVQNGNNVSDADVIAISSQARYDACLLEFDFIPICDTLHITYVFGSEEYPRYIYQYNDVFAMFLTGPNPAGGNYLSQNIATLPNGTTPVSIFTVNGGWPLGSGAANPAFYVDNYTNPNSDIVYDGYTIPITSVVSVTPCQTYHMKIAVVDALNGKYDSGVFIQGNTFTCTTAPVSAINSSDACINTGTATVTVSNYSGTPTYQWSPGGQTTASITNLIPGDYNCVITYPGLCTTDSLTVTIDDVQPTVAAMAGDTICIGQSVSLTAIGSGGASGYTYSWSTGGVPVSSSVNPTTTTTYDVVAIDQNGCSSLPQTVSVEVNPPLTVHTIPVVNVCAGTSNTLSSAASGGNENISYSWSPVAGLNNPLTSDPVVTLVTSAIYTLTVTDNCGTPAVTAYSSVNVQPLPLPVISANVLNGCAPLCVMLTDTTLTNCIDASWSFGDGEISTDCGITSHCYTIAGTYTITYEVTDTSGCFGTGTQTNYITVLPQLTPAFSYSPNPVVIVDPSVNFIDQSTDATKWQWSFSQNSDDTSSLKNPNFIYPDTGCYPLQLIVTSQYGCADTLNSEICVEMEFEFYAPNTFTPNDDGINEIFHPYGTGVSESDYEFMIFDRWGQEVFKTNRWGEGWNGKVKEGGKLVQLGTYVWLVRVYDIQRNFHQYTGKVSVVN